MEVKAKKFSAIRDYIYFIVFLIAISTILSGQVFVGFNYFILDRFQGQIEPRSEIVIIGIDDASLQGIGAWPWNRDIYATAFTNLEKLGPRVAALDVLFLEERPGDSQFQEVLNKAKFKTVFGAKTENDRVLESRFSGNNQSVGLIDFAPDNDGKIRRLNLSRKVGDNCQNSFGLEIVSKYLLLKNSQNCQDQLQLRSNTVPNNFEFVYTDSEFKKYSFLDLYQGKIEAQALKDKIVIFGSTAKDLRSSLNDNFTSVFGGTLNGVEIHANVVNSVLNSKYLQYVSYQQAILGVCVLALFAFWINRKIDNNLIELSVFLALILATNIAGVLLYNYGYSWYFFQSNLILIFGYFYFIANKYLVVKKESRLVEKAFSKYVNSEVLREIKNNPQALQLGGSKKVVTVLFSDIRGFTSFSEKLSPEELISLINKYLTLMTDIILSNGGTVDKYIGDAIMAFWNAPISQENHQYLAIKTSLEMQQGLKKLNLDISFPIKIGVGINTGDVIVGNVGSDNRFDYTILGDTVNLGSRLEGLTKKYGLTTLIAMETLTNLNEKQELIYRVVDEVRVKGKQKAIKICEPLENTPKNQEFKEKYEQAFELYQQSEFTKASKIFEKLEKTDPVSAKMLERISTIKSDSKLHTDWTGIWNWEEK